MSVKDGGPAFPSHGSMGEVTHEGMTLRDYFAAKAMQSLLAEYATIAQLTSDAYRIADAMLAEREEEQ